MRVLGIDGGIASIGWAVVEVEHDDGEAPVGKVLGVGVRTFEAPETDKERTPKNQIRRQFRAQRRVISRRRQRMNAIRELFKVHALLPSNKKHELRVPSLDPWQLRAEGLDRLLTPPEFAIALGHIARHRGFRSNAKRDRGANAAGETKGMLGNIEATRQPLLNHQYRTVGEMLARDPAFSDHKRNRGGAFTRSVLRDDQQDEVNILFRNQRRFGSAVAKEDLQAAFVATAFSQKGFQSSEQMVGDCPFEAGQKRAARFSPSFERFRFLSRLATLRLLTGRAERRLSEDEIGRAANGFGSTVGISFIALRKLLELETNTRFDGVGRDDERRDVVARNGGACDGTNALRKIFVVAVGDMRWRELAARGEALDRIASALTFREDVTDIRAGIAETGVEPAIVEAVMAGLDAGAFKKFKGTGHISALAARNMLPGLMRGLDYFEAAAEAGYDHSARPATCVEKVGSPVARKALVEMLKQVTAVHHAYGPFDRIHVELARDVGKSLEERGKLERGIEERTAAKNHLRDEMRDLLKVADVSGEDLLRYELWKEQGGKSLYTDAAIPIQAVLATDNRVQVDHILPWSRFGDDSYINKTICLSGENQDKGGATPHEWFSAKKSSAEWEAYSARVEMAKIKGRKKRNFLLKNAKDVEDKFRSRNLNDTRYATRVLLDELKRRYPAPEGEVRIFSRPGELTSKLRRAWGIERLKKGPDGKRLTDDRHHALDAMVVAAISNGQLQRLTRAHQEAEEMGLARDFRGLPEPWVGFREQAEAALRDIFVSRAEVHRARGEAHAATIKQVRQVDGADVVFERKAIEKLTLKDLALIPVPEPYGKVANPMKLHAKTVASLQAWIEAGKPKSADKLPRSPKGDVIRKVRVSTSDKVAVDVRGGTADRGDMARVDVFQKATLRGVRQYFVVPVYPHEIALLPEPPMKAVAANQPVSDWPQIDDKYGFLWSIYRMSLIELTKSDGEVILGYFRGMDRATGAIHLSAVNDSTLIRRGIGARTLKEFKKLTVDRLGDVAAIDCEVRTWRGKACT